MVLTFLGYKANLFLLKSFLSKGSAVCAMAFCREKELLNNNDVASYTVEHHHLGRSLASGKPIRQRVYRFSFDGINTIGLELDDWLEVFPKSWMTKPIRPALERHAAWLEDREPVPEYEAYAEFLRRELAEFKAEYFIFNEATSLKIAANSPHLVRIFIVHCCEHLPFGPYAAVPGFGSSTSEVERRRIIEDTDGIWVVSAAMKEYVEKYGGIKSTQLPLHPLLYGEGPDWPFYDNFDTGKVVAINPGAVKGFTIFRDLVASMPDVEFGAVKAWNVNESQVKELESFTNLTLYETFSNMEVLWRNVKLLVAPSVWYEVFGLVVVEAQLRGIPVIASAVGGLPEAKCGTSFGIIPVNLLSGERTEDPSEIASTGVYKYPPQDVSPWIREVKKLIYNRDIYRAASEESRQKSKEFVRSIDTDCYEKWFRQLARAI